MLTLRDLLEQRLGLGVVLHPDPYAIVQVSRHENLSILAVLSDDEIQRNMFLALSDAPAVWLATAALAHREAAAYHRLGVEELGQLRTSSALLYAHSGAGSGFLVWHIEMIFDRDGSTSEFSNAKMLSECSAHSTDDDDGCCVTQIFLIAESLTSPDPLSSGQLGERVPVEPIDKMS